MTNDRRCREHAGGIEVARWVNAVSIQAHIKGGGTNKKYVTNDRRCREHAGGIYVGRWANTMSIQAHIKCGWTTK